MPRPRRPGPPRSHGSPRRRVERLRRLTVSPGNAPVSPLGRAGGGRSRAEALEPLRPKLAAVGLRLEDVAPGLSVFEVAAGQAIPTPNDRPDFLTVVSRGCAKTIALLPTLDPAGERRGPASLTLQFAKPGYVVGLAPHRPDTDSGHFGAVAHVDSTIVMVGHEVIRDVLRRLSPTLRLGMFAYHARAMSRLIHHKTASLALGVKERLLRELVELRRTFAGSSAPGPIDLPLSHADLAALVGASREHVTRTLVALERERLLRADRLRCTLLAAPAPDRDAPLPARRRERSPVVEAGRQIRAPAAVERSCEQIGLPKRAAGVLARHAEVRAYDAGERIAPIRGMKTALLVEGAARVMVHTEHGPAGVWVAKEGHFIASGRLGGGESQRHAFWAVAVTPCLVATFTEEVTAEVLGALSAEDLLAFFDSCHVALARQLYTRCVLLSLGNAERLLYLLHVLAHDFPRPVAGGVEIALPLQPSRDLAPLVAASRTALSRALSDLQAAGHLRIESGRLAVRGA
jgi:CRP-like cAMP-binding protein